MKKTVENFSFNARDQIEINLFKGKVYLLSGEIERDNIDDCIKWILSENITGDNVDLPLKLYINSIGGDLYDAFALVDIIKSSSRPVHTYALGSVMSAAFLIFACGLIGHRYAYKNCGFMMHQHIGSVEGKHHDLKASVKEMDQSNSRMINILKEATLMTPSKVRSIFLPPSDVFFTAEEAVKLGIADHII